MADVRPASVDLLCCFEVLEHLEDDALVAFFSESLEAVKPGGSLLASVPIMAGLAVPLKDTNRMLLHRRRAEHTIGEMLAATFLGKMPNRPDRARSHKGFDFRQLERMLTDRFTLIERHWSPFPALPWWMNSQVFFVLRHREP